ncbi:MAG: hypothetical protein ALECFALPRED_002096 [Alectoria fallacina]|uniref:Uncharacterized protein n=1 Tax=Alectoria fallacina TaxID=1903189 RepID=A0A8H3FFD7_9LECA|nr:MAG: hypothetical protein ALECFALPRED_002096 [Alectoria fallacina]
MDPNFSLERPVGLFDMNHAFKITKGDKGKEYVFRIDHWAETVAPRFDLEKGEKTVIDDKGEKLVFGIAGWPEDRTLEGDHSLQLCDVDRNPPKPSEEELAAIAKSETHYFAQNDYFIDESGDGRFPSQTSHSSQTQNSIKHSMRQRPKKWVCTLCGVQSIEGDDAYYQHLELSHTADMEETATDVKLWKRLMLDEAYWNGVDGITPTPSIVRSSRPKSVFLKNEGRWDEAEELEVQVMETSLRVLGQEHPDTLSSMASLASTYRNQGRWNEAEKLEVQVMETRRWNEAEKLEVQVIKTRKRVLGQEHPDTLSSMTSLASTYRNQGRWNEVEKLEVQVMKTSLRVLGQEHPDTLSSMANLAATYRNQGRWDESIELIQVVVNLRTKIIGANHPDTLGAVDLLDEWSS